MGQAQHNDRMIHPHGIDQWCQEISDYQVQFSLKQSLRCWKPYTCRDDYDDMLLNLTAQSDAMQLKFSDEGFGTRWGCYVVEARICLVVV
jgi:hypothetical protein